MRRHDRRQHRDHGRSHSGRRFAWNDAPPQAAVHRKEVYEAIKREKQAAANNAGSPAGDIHVELWLKRKHRNGVGEPAGRRRRPNSPAIGTAHFRIASALPALTPAAFYFRFSISDCRLKDYPAGNLSNRVVIPTGSTTGRESSFFTPGLGNGTGPGLSDRKSKIANRKSGYELRPRRPGLFLAPRPAPAVSAGRRPQPGHRRRAGRRAVGVTAQFRIGLQREIAGRWGGHASSNRTSRPRPEMRASSGIWPPTRRSGYPVPFMRS